MVYVIVAIVILSVMLTYFIESKNKEKMYKSEVGKEFGKLKGIKNNDINLEETRGYFDYVKEKLDFYIDDITWNDFNLDEIYKSINRTGTSVGDEVLYKLLREQNFNKDELKRRDKIIDYFKNNKLEREKISLVLKKIGKSETCRIYEFNVDKEKNNYKLLWILGKLPIVFCCLVFVHAIFLIFAMASIFINIYIAQKSYKYNNCKLVDYQYIIGILKAGSYIDSLNLKVLNESYENINDHLKNLRKIKNKRFVSAENSISEVAGTNEFLKLFFLSEAIKIEKMGTTLRNNEEDMKSIYKYVGEIESFIAIASFREYIKEFVKPEFINSKDIEVENLYFPLIKNPILNSVKVDNSILLTGSNASGKSTFLRSLGINIIFAQSFNMTFSSKYKGGFFKVYSSMALKDDLLSKESYYMAESKSLKRIIDAEKGDENIICFIDEILRGTNTIERIAASSQILKYLSKNGYKVIAATHDIELTEILKNYYSNYHFSEKIFENEIVFDYKLYKGKTRTRNAIKILEILGYEEEVIKSAEKSAEEFTLNNKWAII